MSALWKSPHPDPEAPDWEELEWEALNLPPLPCPYTAQFMCGKDTPLYSAEQMRDFAVEARKREPVPEFLRKYNAADVVIEADGTGWWFATPETDQRLWLRDFRTPEAKPRRRRRAKIISNLGEAN